MYFKQTQIRNKPGTRYCVYPQRTMNKKQRTNCIRFKMPKMLFDASKNLIVVMLTLSFGLSCNPLSQHTQHQRQPQLCQGSYLSEAAARHQLAEFARSYSNLRQWKARKKRIRQGILRGAELLPPPKKCPLCIARPQAADLLRVSSAHTAISAADGFETTSRNVVPHSLVWEPSSFHTI